MRSRHCRRVISLVISAVCMGSGADAASQVGVLLGLRGPSGHRTLWIQRQGSILVLSRELQGIVVPYGRDLCELKFSTVKTIPDPEWIGEPPIHEYAAIALDCGKGLSTLPLEDSGGCWGRTTIELLFVSSSHVSLQYERLSSCYGRPSGDNRLVVAPISEIVGGWSIEPPSSLPLDSLGPARGALTAAAVRACKSADQETRTYLELRNCSEATPQEWGIERDHGEWTIVGRTHGWKGNYLDYSVAGSLPAAIRSWSRRALSVAGVAAEAPDAQDFVTSPGDALAVVTRPHAVQAGIVQSGHLVLGDELTAKNPDERIISVEWATGRYVSDWDARVRQMPATETPRRRTTR